MRVELKIDVCDNRGEPNGPRENQSGRRGCETFIRMTVQRVQLAPSKGYRRAPSIFQHRFGFLEIRFFFIFRAQDETGPPAVALASDETTNARPNRQSRNYDSRFQHMIVVSPERSTIVSAVLRLHRLASNEVVFLREVIENENMRDKVELILGLIFSSFSDSNSFLL